VGLGLLAGSGAAYVLTTFMDPASLALWGWRVPFVFGFLLAPVGYYLRSRVGETPAFERTLARHEVAASPLRLALTIHRGKVLTGLGLTVIWTVSSYLFLTFMPSYVTQTLHMPASVALASNTVAILILTVLTPRVGALSDRIGRRKMLLTSAIGYFLLSYPLFLLVTERRDFLGLAIAQAVAAVLMPVLNVASTGSNVGSGCFSLSTMVAGPAISTVETEPSSEFQAPCVGSRARSNDHCTSFAVIGMPSENLIPSRSVMVSVLPSSLQSHLVARPGFRPSPSDVGNSNVS